MPVLNFPSSPAAQTPLNIYSPSSTPASTANGVTYKWDGVKWQSVEQTVVDDYTYPGGVKQTVQARLEQYVSVEDFGAKGDGVTDDYAAIQATFNAATSAGLICNVPQGTFMVSSLEMPSGLYIQGAGNQVTIFEQIADSVGPVLKSSYGSNLKMITIQDFYVDGNRDNFTDPTMASTLKEVLTPITNLV